MNEVADFLAYYRSVCKRTRRVAERVPADRLEWSPGAERFSAGDIIRHIAATERWMWGENAHLRPSRYPGHGEALASGKEAVLAYLERMQEETADVIASLGPDDLEARCTTVGGIDMRVWKWLRLMVEHQIHHRGQLYGLLAELGVKAPSLYGLTEREVRERSEPGPT